jgi:hypothetical protein
VAEKYLYVAGYDFSITENLKSVGGLEEWEEVLLSEWKQL